MKYFTVIVKGTNNAVIYCGRSRMSAIWYARNCSVACVIQYPDGHTEEV